MSKVAILHEGNDKETADKKLIKNLLENMNLDPNLVFFNQFGGKGNFFKLDNPKYLKLQELVDSEQINKILFIVDADNEKDDTKYKGFENTEKELQNIINKLGFQDIAKFYVVCDPVTKIGYLESLIFASLPEGKQQCINSFIECSGSNPKLTHKRIINHLYTMAYPEPPYNFDHPHFDELKEKLKTLFINSEE